MAVLRGQSAALYHHANETGELHFVAGVRAEGDKLIPARPLIPDAIPYRAARTGQLQLVEDLHASEDFRRYDDYPNLDYGGLVALPIKRGNGVDEVLCVALPSGRQWSHFDHQTLELLLIQAGGHLENAALYDNVDSGNRRMRAILDSARDGIIMLDRHGILSEFNVSAERILNVDLGDYRGENFALALLNTARAGGFSEDNTRDVLTEMARVLRTEPQRITNRSLEIRRGSEIRYVEEVGSPVFDSRRNITGRLLTLRDVTEERLLAAYRDEISNMVVHDLKSPLSTIITSLTLAVDILSLVEPRHDDLDVVEQTLQVSLSSATALLSLVESLLDIAKLETRHMPLRRAPASFNDIVQNAYMALAAFAQEAHIHVDLRVPAHLPPVDVDADKIRRVVINLLDNALRYTPSGGMIQVSAAMSDHKVLVRVADSGRGIPPEESEHIFEKFRQIANNNPSRGKKGVGLGLTFCKLTLEAHGERIWVDHDGPLPGACFAFTLPTASVPAGSPLHSA
jgi:PAS domain S-box-containing protein